MAAVLGAPRELCVREGEVVKRWTEVPYRSWLDLVAERSWLTINIQPHLCVSSPPKQTFLSSLSYGPTVTPFSKHSDIKRWAAASQRAGQQPRALAVGKGEKMIQPISFRVGLLFSVQFLKLPQD